MSIGWFWKFLIQKFRLEIGKSFLSSLLFEDSFLVNLLNHFNVLLSFVFQSLFLLGLSLISHHLDYLALFELFLIAQLIESSSKFVLGLRVTYYFVSYNVHTFITQLIKQYLYYYKYIII